jgi:hypothetical protein
MRYAKLSVLASIMTAAVALAAPAHADPDVDFANELHTYGIYGPKHYDAWIGKITCQRLDNGLDKDANMSAKFVFRQLPKNATTVLTLGIFPISKEMSHLACAETVVQKPSAPQQGHQIEPHDDWKDPLPDAGEPPL